LERIPLHSTFLAWVGYLPDLRLLQVGLRTGQDYEYFDVPVATYSDLLASESKGRYYNLHIRNEFRFQKIKKNTAN
jgi:KTSC domain